MFRRHRSITPVVSMMLAVLAAAPAYARLELNPPAGATHASAPASANLCSEVCAAGGYTSPGTGATLAHDPRPRAVALAGAGYGYGSTPTSSGANNPRSEVVSGGGYGHPNAPATVRVGAPSSGFDWGDAGIGAGSAVALMTLLVGAAFGVTSVRRRAATRSAA